MDYEKAYKEALERAKSLIDKEGLNAREAIFPELAESEDERIMEDAIIPFNIKYRDKIERGEYKVRTYRGNPVTIYRWDFKDKDGTPILGSYVFGGYEYAAGWYEDGRFGQKASDLDLALFPSEDKEVPLTPVARQLSDFLKNDFEYFASKKWTEKEWNKTMNLQAAELQRIAYLEKQKGNIQAKVEQRMKYLWDKLPDADKVEEGNCTPEEWKALGAYMELEMNFDRGSEEKQPEQKPTEKQDYSGLTDFERAIHRGFLCAGVENVPVDMIKETAQDCLAQIEQKPAEWGEEDEAMRNNIIRVLSAFVGTVECESNPSLSSSYPTYYKEIDWLKSLRSQPHWKPTKEQMEALKCAVEDVAKFSKRGGRQVELENEPYYRALHSLYCNLEKLM